MEIVPGLHQLKTPMPSPALPYVMAYAFVGDGVSLFDTGHGTPAAKEVMTAELKRLGFEPKDVVRVIISHAHPDHLGMAGWVKEQSPDCEVVMLDREWEWMGSRYPRRDGDSSSMEDWLRSSDGWLVKHGVPRSEVEQGRNGGSPWAPGDQKGNAKGAAGGANPFGMMGTAVEPDVKLQDGDDYEFEDWALQAVWTPGHTPGHLCLYERNRKLMFTGDHVLPHISPNVSLHSDQDGTSPLADFFTSLKKVAQFDTSLALPAHEFTFADLPGRVSDLLSFHAGRLDEVRQAIGEGTATAGDVSAGVHWNTGKFEDFSVHMKRSALGETLSHLVVLEDEGRVTRHDDGERVLWEQA